MYLTNRNKLQKAMLSTTYMVGGQRISLTEPDNYMMSFLACQGILTWAIINSDSTSRGALESDLKKMKLKFDEARAKGEDPIASNGFFIHNISLRESRSLAKKYRLRAFVFGNELGEAELEWLKPAHKEEIERLLLIRVRGCIHRRDCTTGCWEREARVLHLNGVKPETAREIIQKWRTEGIPDAWISEEDFPFEHWMKDLEYKESVIDVLERWLNGY